jgi:hypothetical protein
MDSESKFWLGIVGIVSTAITVIVVSSCFYYTRQNQIVADMVKGGASPIAARCAVQDGFGKNPSCIVYATGDIVRKP